MSIKKISQSTIIAIISCFVNLISLQLLSTHTHLEFIDVLIIMNYIVQSFFSPVAIFLFSKYHRVNKTTRYQLIFTQFIILIISYLILQLSFEYLVALLFALNYTLIYRNACYLKQSFQGLPQLRLMLLVISFSNLLVTSWLQTILPETSLLPFLFFYTVNTIITVGISYLKKSHIK